MREVYLDNNATTEPLPEVRQAMVGALENAWGNPSSAHSGGANARRLIGVARESVAALTGAEPSHVHFTSGGTEANVLALRSCFSPSSPQRLITSVIEHSSVVNTARQLEQEGSDVVWLKPDRSGRIDPKDVQHQLEDQPRSAVSIQWVNNETGVINDIESIGAIALACGARFHCDAAQAAGKLSFDLESLPIDILTLTAHKFHGPAGVGALIIKDPRVVQPILFGGDQEKGLRPGTENIVGIVGFGAAANSRSSSIKFVGSNVEQLRNRFESGLGATLPETKINGGRAPRVCNTSNVLFPEIDGQALMAQLDAAGIRCSQSSACTNQRPEPSYVLRAMNLSEGEAYRSVRFSFSELNSMEDVDYTIGTISGVYQRLAPSFLNKPMTARAEVTR